MKKRKHKNNNSISSSSSSSDSNDYNYDQESVNDDDYNYNNIPRIREINTLFIKSLLDYYEEDHIIERCDTIINNSAFNNEWIISWGDINGNNIKTKPSYFNLSIVKNELKRILKLAFMYIKLFGFCGFYIKKDIDQWIINNMNSKNINNNNLLNDDILPFDVIPFREDYGNYYEVREYGEIKTKIIFKPHPSSIYEKNFNFFVFSRSPKINNNIHPRFITNSSTGSIGIQSTFLKYYELYSEYNEYRGNRADADLGRSHPPTYIYIKPIGESKILDSSNLGEDEMYDNNRTNDSLTKLNQSHQIGNYNMAMQYSEEAVNQIRRIAKEYGNLNDKTNNDPDNVTRNKFRKYNRATYADVIHTIPSFVEVKPVSKPETIIDIDKVKEEYETTICREFNIPYMFYKTDLITSSSKSESTFLFYDNLLRDNVKTIQDLYSQIFDYIYINTFMIYDIRLIDSIKNNNNNKQTKFNIQKLRLEFSSLESQDSNSLKSGLELWDRGLIKDDDIIKSHQNLYGKSMTNNNNNNKKKNSSQDKKRKNNKKKEEEEKGEKGEKNTNKKQKISNNK